MAFRDKSDLHGWPDGHSARSLPPVTETARRLQHALVDHHIGAEVHEGYGLALVSVWVGLVVWCDGLWFWWRVGWNERSKSVMYARHPATDPARAARRVAFQYADLRARRARPEVTSGAAPVQPDGSAS